MCIRDRAMTNPRVSISLRLQQPEAIASISEIAVRYVVMYARDLFALIWTFLRSHGVFVHTRF